MARKIKNNQDHGNTAGQMGVMEKERFSKNYSERIMQYGSTCFNDIGNAWRNMPTTEKLMTMGIVGLIGVAACAYAGMGYIGGKPTYVSAYCDDDLCIKQYHSGGYIPSSDIVYAQVVADPKSGMVCKAYRVTRDFTEKYCYENLSEAQKICSCAGNEDYPGIPETLNETKRLQEIERKNKI